MFESPKRSASSFRSVCYRCHKATVVCICSTVPKVQNRTAVSIIQHPRERFHPIGTVRFARLGLENARVIVHGPNHPPPPILESLPARTGLLYPGPGARVLSEVPREERPEHLVVLDGTWAQAKSLYRALPELSRLPHFALAPESSGQYRIRREPTATALSTIEAIVQALEILEPETAGLGDLLGAFTRMIDRQIVFTHLVRPRAARRRRRSRERTLPPILGAQPERVVLAYGEFVASPLPGAPHELVYWAGIRLGTGETFQHFLRPPTLSAVHPTERQLGHMGFSREQLEGGADLETFRRAWGGFFREDDTLFTWHQSTRDNFQGVTGYPDTQVLKAIYCNTRRAPAGGLADALRTEGLEPVENPFLGRPRLVLGQSLALARLLGRLASEP